ncbi:TonB-dependent receptor [Mucilaginibacter sp.]|uniref:TonB-dependent receptor domain-containing protein n=1 Tax=Mucilaginibacter sp. TaxID=1882438 RepID=UPI00260179BD|nr:TonB-dependent receptor [Mucilaginibacter sp.]MDB4926839.1 TonB-dependent receptor [Mucilaginibacter sp.]
MKKLLLIIFSICFSVLAFGQNQKSLTVKGLVIDSVSKQPIGYATIGLQNTKTQVAVKSALTKDDGVFEITVPAGKYQLALANMGYKAKTIPVTDTISTIDVGKIVMSASSKQLNDVTITGMKPLMKQEVDKLTYDVQADPESKVVTALDMIRKVPLLSVDATDNIKLRGSGNYKILINGRESAMMAKNPSDILKSMPGTNIIKIEVITTPPAKYDAEGLAGIINIITTKKADQGYNGSIGVNYNTVWGSRLNVNLTVKQGKLGYTGYVGTGKRPKNSSRFGNQSDFYSPVSSLVQNGLQFRSGTNTYTSNELSYEIDSLNLISGMFNHYNGTNTNGNDQVTTQFNAANMVNQSYHLLNSGTGNYTGTDMGINYQLGFKHNKDRLLTISYKYSNSGNKQFNDVLADNRLNYSIPNYRQYDNSGSKEYTTQLDYVQPFKVLTIEAGGKMILRNNYSNSHNDTLATSNQYITAVNQNNDFTYHQNVYSLYNSYQLKFTKYTFKGGLRFERTNIEANSSTANQSYNNLVPSFSAQRKLNTTSSLTFGFTERIQRPGIYQLNPFQDKQNTKFINIGNPNLRPAVNNNFELGYSNFAKGSINISTNYTFANNTIQNVSSVSNGITTTTFANVGKNQGLGIDVNIQYPVTKKMNVNINSELLQVWLKGTYNGTFFTNSGQQGHIFTYTDYKFDNGVRVGVNIGFDSRYVLLQGRDNYYFNNAYSASKELFNKKATLSLFVANPLSKFNKIDFFTKTPDFQSYNYNMNFYRTFGLNFMYKFGKLNGSIKKNQRGINNDDTSSGSRN